jgi:predicted nucleic acid-binding protein
MADKLILIDTSILIEYYRKTDKTNSRWIALVRSDYEFAISVVTKFEIFAGATPAQLEFWNIIFQQLVILPFDDSAVDTAVRINADLKRKRKQIDLADLFIASTAVQYKLPLATLNAKHFDRVEGLTLL